MEKTEIDSSHISKLVQEMATDSQIVSIDANDIRQVLNDKKGVLYQMSKDKDMSVSNFLRNFFAELKFIQQVKESSHYLVYIRCIQGENQNLTMDDMCYLDDFWEEVLEREDTVFYWGVGVDKRKDANMTITVLCTKE